MKTLHFLWFAAAVVAGSSMDLRAGNSPAVLLEKDLGTVRLSWPATQVDASGAVLRPYYQLLRSEDLRNWQPVGERLRASAAAPEARLAVTLPSADGKAFYRLLQTQAQLGRLAQGGAEVFGYADAFAEELERIGQISPAEFAEMYPNSAEYLPALTWDPTQAAYWQDFAADPRVLNADKTYGEPGYRFYDYRLGADELALFKKNGFVVSQRLAGRDFADLFYRMWHDDLPVFISCDAVLHAWHRTYDAILEEMEETYLIDTLGGLLDALAAKVPEAANQVGEGVLRDSLYDADYFLAVARALLAGTGAPGLSPLGQDARVAEALDWIGAERLMEVPDFLGFCRMVDFSQFKVRGHYTHSDRLGRYFKCMMWLGRIDIPVAGGPWERCPGQTRHASPRELGVSIVLWSLLDRSGQFDTWASLEKTIEMFVGWTDSLTFGQLDGILAGAGIRTLTDVKDLSTLEAIQSELKAGNLGAQNIRSDWFAQPLRGRFALPQTFTFLGQKFVPDSWAMSQTVFSSIQWVENGETNKVMRRVPGALDVAFGVLANDQVVPDLVARMEKTFLDTHRPHAVLFRDGYPYQHNLAAVRSVMDRHTEDAWGGNLYMNWLQCLRELSAPTTDARYPETMRTHAWAMKTLNTQLGSWTQLRHDTILYAKQSYTDSILCSYPAAFVEARPEFWAGLAAMADRAADLISRPSYSGLYGYLTYYTTNGFYSPSFHQVTLSDIQARQVQHLRRFASVAGRMEALAEKELAQLAFSEDDLTFVNGLIEQPGQAPGGCGGPATYSGWYPELFYRAVHWTDEQEFHSKLGAGGFDALVADVHTDVPDPNIPDCGSVLHEAVGLPNLMFVAVENGGAPFVCAGPVLSHYEFEVLGEPRRLSDQEWWWVIKPDWYPSYGSSIQNVPRDKVLPPSWTREYLVP